MTASALEPVPDQPHLQRNSMTLTTAGLAVA